MQTHLKGSWVNLAPCPWPCVKPKSTSFSESSRAILPRLPILAGIRGKGSVLSVRGRGHLPDRPEEGLANNVIASTATAGVNVRIMVGDTISSVLAHLRKAVRDKEVTVEFVNGSEASPISPYEGDPAFELITSTIATPSI